MANPQYLGTLIIPLNGTASNIMTEDVFGRCRSLSLLNLDSALTGVVTLKQGALDGATFVTVQSPSGTDVALAAAKSVILLAAPFNAIRLGSTIAEAAIRTWEVWGNVGE